VARAQLSTLYLARLDGVDGERISGADGTLLSLPQPRYRS
jgi:hypothetical protein